MNGTVRAIPDLECAIAETVTGAAADFPAWGTRRKPWRGFKLRLSGDENLVTDVLDGLRVV